MKIIFSKLPCLVGRYQTRGPVIVPNALINATQSESRAVIQASPGTSTVSLCNANFRRVRLGETTYMGRSCRGTR
jgi:hypothetical protein